MPLVPSQLKRSKNILYRGMDDEYDYVKLHFKDLARFYLPRRYNALDEGKKVRGGKERNKHILDPHGTQAARTLASGMLYGATNPTHRWLKLSSPDKSVVAQRWIDAVVDLTLKLLGRTNIYNNLGTSYLDTGVFGTSPILLYEDRFSLVRGYNVPAGEYRIMKDERGKISYLGRKLCMTADQVLNRFGAANLSSETLRQATNPTNNKFEEVTVYHLIEPNIPPILPPHFTFREYYWEANGTAEMMLSVAGYYEKPFIAPRWEVVGNETFGVSPGMDALPDVISLQQMCRERAIGLAKQARPPVAMDAILKNQPSALMPDGITWVPSSSAVGAKPLYTVNMPYGELQQDRMELKNSISRGFYNDLFRAILDLRTVRSATEIQEASAEKLILLGPVTNRLEDEALSDLVQRVLGILNRAGVIPPSPTNAPITIEYDSIFSNAQKAAGIGNVERFMAAVGQVLPIAPEVNHVLDWRELVYEYGDRLNIPARTVRTREEVEARLQQERELAQANQEAEIAAKVGQAAGALANAAPQA